MPRRRVRAARPSRSSTSGGRDWPPNRFVIAAPCDRAIVAAPTTEREKRRGSRARRARMQRSSCRRARRGPRIRKRDSMCRFESSCIHECGEAVLASAAQSSPTRPDHRDPERSSDRIYTYDGGLLVGRESSADEPWTTRTSGRYVLPEPDEFASMDHRLRRDESGGRM